MKDFETGVDHTDARPASGAEHVAPPCSARIPSMPDPSGAWTPAHGQPLPRRLVVEPDHGPLVAPAPSIRLQSVSPRTLLVAGAVAALGALLTSLGGH